MPPKEYVSRVVVVPPGVWNEESRSGVTKRLDLRELHFSPEHLAQQAHVGLGELEFVELVTGDEKGRFLALNGETVGDEALVHNWPVVDDAVLDEVLLVLLPVPFFKAF